MKRRALWWLWTVCLSGLLACGVAPGRARAELLQPERGLLQVGDAAPVAQTLPMRWMDKNIGVARLVLRVDFAATQEQAESARALYLLYFFDGGRISLNGTRLATIPESDAQQFVRWRQPHLLSLPPGAVREGQNRLELDVPAPRRGAAVYLPRPMLGPLAELASRADTRRFWVDDLTQITVAVCLLVSAAVLLLWVMRPREVLYGLFGLATLIWGLRTLGFLVDTVPVGYWPAWRAFHHLTASGSAAALAMLSLRFAGMVKPRLEYALIGWALLAPLLVLASGGELDARVGQIWGIAGLGIGCLALGGAIIAVVRQRSVPAWAVLVAYVLIILAGLHDYLMFWHAPLMIEAFPGWAEHAILLLRYAVNVLLLTIAVTLIHRFVATLDQLEEVNQTLERRVAEREAQLAGNFQRLRLLEREHATVEERRRIMEDMHDGLGSRLFTALARNEYEELHRDEIGEILRSCVSEMRLALEALAPDDDDFAAAFGNFRFRWEAQLVGAGIRSTWRIDGEDKPLLLGPRISLQLLRIIQEALTNVLKHANARQVHVRLTREAGVICLEVEDDGCGLPAVALGGGRGLLNLRSRARRLGGQLEFLSQPGQTRIRLRLADPASLPNDSSRHPAYAG